MWHRFLGNKVAMLLGCVSILWKKRAVLAYYPGINRPYSRKRCERLPKLDKIGQALLNDCCYRWSGSNPPETLLRTRKPDRPAGRWPLSEHPADAHDPAGVSGACDRQRGSGARTLSRLRGRPVAKLKLGAIADDKPVKPTLELPAVAHRDLVAYEGLWVAKPVSLSPSQLS